MEDYDRKFANEVGKALAKKAKEESREKQYRAYVAQISGNPTPLAPDLGWVCDKCKTFNKDGVSVCRFCDTPRLSG